MTATATILDQISDTIASFEGSVLHFDPPAQGPTAGICRPIESLDLHADVRSLIQQRFPAGLYRHQYEAIVQILTGKNTVVATRTASGKSLIFSLPVLHTLCDDPTATSLFLYPQKALANDQLLKLRQLGADLPMLGPVLQQRPCFVSRYDGGTPSQDRSRIREEVQIILTNPDMLHYSLLQYHDRHWARFFRNLRHIVIDECHEYRGIFGANVAHILRRLRQVCRHHGADPAFIATSATMHQPQQHLQRLAGVGFTCVNADRDGSRQGVRKFWMVSGSEHFYDYGRKLAFDLAEQGLTVLAFCPGRIAAERMMARLTSSQESDLSHVRVYRAGLSAAEREEIENGLGDKSVRLVFSTSALELGIDIGAVDAVVCIGLPNSMMSLWQRAGRAARGGKDGGVVLVPGDTPIDTYYANHPDELFAKENEPLVLSIANRRVVCQQYACATQEVGGDEDALDTKVLGEEIHAVQQARAAGQLDLDVFYRADPHMQVNIRSIGEGNYKLVLASNEEAIGEIDEFHLLREAYLHAIYRHGGRGYRVRDVIRGRRKVILERESSRNETRAFIQKKIRLKRRHRVLDFAEVMLAKVNVDVTECLLNVTEKDRGGKVIHSWNGNMGMPTHTLPTEATLLRLKRPLWQQVIGELGQHNARSALQSCERLLWGLFPTVSGPCDKQDFSSAWEEARDGSASIYLYDLVYDGVGLTVVACDRMMELIDKAIERLIQCGCEDDAGCFRCIASPIGSDVTSKRATLWLLQQLRIPLDGDCSITETNEDSVLHDIPSSKPCPACCEPVRPGDRFCSNCGEKQSE